jgi:hypothetical protein
LCRRSPRRVMECGGKAKHDHFFQFLPHRSLYLIIISSPGRTIGRSSSPRRILFTKTMIHCAHDRVEDRVQVPQDPPPPTTGSLFFPLDPHPALPPNDFPSPPPDGYPKFSTRVALRGPVPTGEGTILSPPGTRGQIVERIWSPRPIIERSRSPRPILFTKTVI